MKIRAVGGGCFMRRDRQTDRHVTFCNFANARPLKTTQKKTGYSKEENISI